METKNKIEILWEEAYATQFRLASMFKFNDVTYEIVGMYIGGGIDDIELRNEDGDEIYEDDMDNELWWEIRDAGIDILHDLDFDKHLNY